MVSIYLLKQEEAADTKKFLQHSWNEIFGDHPNPIIRDYFSVPGSLDDMDDVLLHYFSNGGLFLVGKEKNEIVAAGGLKKIDEYTCSLVHLFIDSAYRRKGIGRSISMQLVSFAKAKGYKKIKLGSNKLLSASHCLYRSLGFQQISEDEYALYLEKDL